MPTSNLTQGTRTFMERIDNIEAALKTDEGSIVIQNASAQLVANGPVLPLTVPTAITGSDATLTAAQLLSGLIDHSGGTAPTDTTPTATQIVAAIPGCQVGTTIEFAVRNRNSGTLTIAAGTDVTLATGNTNTIATVNTRRFRAVVTGVSTPAVTIYSMGVSAH